ncbi:MAG: hypothetical protein KKC68_03270 [Candidatus Thermoplasmatota archaeon]|nr:hypothetical protein [Candidatus Thermoplasmatota archaeon]
MNENINLKTLEKKAYHINFQDGIYDIMFGILLISFAVAPILREIIGLGYIFFMIVPAPLFYMLAKKYISLPRIGIAKYGGHRKKKHRAMLIISLITFPISIILLTLTYLGPFQIDVSTALGGYAVPISAGLFAIFICGLTAYLIDFSHIFYYGLIVGLGIMITEYLNTIIEPPINNVLTFSLPGFIIILLGLYTLSQFIKKYPIPTEEITNAG